MVLIVVVFNLISVIEVVPKDLTIVESFSHQLPTRSLVPPLCVQPLQILQYLICCHNYHHVVGLPYSNIMIDIPSY